jgi:type IV pilus assembly protein PilM
VFDDYNELTVNQLLESPPEGEGVLVSDILKAEIEEEKEEQFFDKDYLSQIRRDIALIKSEKEALPDEFKAKLIKPRLTFLRRILKILVGWKDFTVVAPEIEEELILELRARKFTLVETLIKEQELIEKQILPKKIDEKITTPKEEISLPFAFLHTRLKIINWLLKFRGKYIGSNYYLNIDIGSDSIKYTHIKKNNGKLTLESYGVEKLHYIPEDSENTRNEKLNNAIKNLIKKEYYDISETIVMISGISRNLRIEKIPKVAKKELKNLILFNIKKSRSSEDEQDMVFDYQILGIEEDKGVEKYVVLIITAPSKQINYYVSILRDNGIIPSKVTFSEIGLWEYVKNFMADSVLEGGIIIDMGASNTMLIFYNQGKILFLRDVKYGSRNFTESIVGTYVTPQSKIDVDFEQAENIKYDFGIPPSDNYAPAFRGITYSQLNIKMKPALGKFLEELKRSINYFHSNYPNVELHKIIFSGGGAMMLHLEEYITQEIGLEIKHISLFDKMKIGKNIIDGFTLSREYHKLINSVGIALEDVKSFNFLPSDLRDLRKKAVTKLSFALSVFVCLLTISLFTHNTLKSFKEIKNKLTETKNKWETTDNTKKEFAVLLNEKENFVKVKNDLEEKVNYFSKNQKTDTILKLISNLIPQSISLNSINYSEEEKEKVRYIVMEGNIIDKSKSIDDILFNFYLSLENSKYFSKIVVNNENSKDLKESGNIPDFVITCYLD